MEGDCIPRNFQQTHENLLQCAKEQFLAFGFERASIREICKEAHVTNGAFYNHFTDKEALFGAIVEPVFQTISQMYNDAAAEQFALVKNDDLLQWWKHEEETLCSMIEYIYAHFEIFQLLLMCSAGTKYADFQDMVVRAEMRETKKFLAELKRRGIPFRNLEDDEWHILVHAHYASLAELVLHNYPKETALKYAHTLAAFFEAGWKAVLGLP